MLLVVFRPTVCKIMGNCRLDVCLLFARGLQFCKNCHFVGHKSFYNKFFLPPWPTVFKKIQNCRLKTVFLRTRKADFCIMPRPSAQTRLQFTEKHETVGQMNNFPGVSAAMWPTCVRPLAAGVQ